MYLFGGGVLNDVDVLFRGTMMIDSDMLLLQLLFYAIQNKLDYDTFEALT